MRLLFPILWLLILPMLSVAQRSPIPDLAAMDWEEAGFNTDSLEALISFIDDFEQLDLRGMVVIKDHKIAMEWYDNNFWRKSILDIYYLR